MFSIIEIIYSRFVKPNLLPVFKQKSVKTSSSHIRSTRQDGNKYFGFPVYIMLSFQKKQRPANNTCKGTQKRKLDQ